MSSRKAYLQLFAVSLLWGGNYVVSAWLLHGFSPIMLAFVRIVFTTLFMLVPLLVIRNMRWPTRREWGLLAGAGLFGTLLNQVLYFTGLSHSTAGNASLIIALAPLATIVLARIFLKEGIGVWKAVGALTGFVGVVVIVLFSGHTGAQHNGILGDAYLFGAMLVLSMSLMFIRWLSYTMDAVIITIYATTVGAIMMMPAAGVEIGVHQARLAHTVTMWALLIAASAFAQGLAGFWWNKGVAVVGASAAAMFMNIPPFIALIVAHLVLGDPIRIAQLVGGCAILGGVLIANRRAPRKHVATATLAVTEISA